MRKAYSPHQRELWSRPIELRVVITNGNPICDTRLKFEFNPDPAGIARVWLLKLCSLKNPDAFTQQLATGVWELRLEAVEDTRPLEILHYTQESATQWLADVFDDKEPSTAELLILAHNEEFTISIHQPSKKER